MLGGHAGRINAVRVANDNKTIITVSDDYTAKVFDLQTGRAMCARACSSSCPCAWRSPLLTHQPHAMSQPRLADGAQGIPSRLSFPGVHHGSWSDGAAWCAGTRWRATAAG